VPGGAAWCQSVRCLRRSRVISVQVLPRRSVTGEHPRIHQVPGYRVHVRVARRDYASFPALLARTCGGGSGEPGRSCPPLREMIVRPRGAPRRGLAGTGATACPRPWCRRVGAAAASPGFPRASVVTRPVCGPSAVRWPSRGDNAVVDVALAAVVCGLTRRPEQRVHPLCARRRAARCPIRAAWSR
jgi:hypothetical protein